MGSAVLKRREGVIVLVTGALIVLGMLTVFAIELNGSLTKSRSDIEKTFRQRAALTSALTSSIFSTTAQSGQTARLLSSPRLSRARLDAVARRGQSAFVAVLDADGRLVATSSGLTGAARADLAARRPRLLAALARAPIALTDVLPVGAKGSGLIEYAQAVPTPAGRRIQVTGFDPRLLAGFLGGYLRRATDVAGGNAYVLDSHGAVVGGTSPAARPGVAVPEPGLIASFRSAGQGSFGDNRWFASSAVADSTWHVVLSAAKGHLFASVNGARKWVPWIIFGAFAIVAAGALLLARRLIRASAALGDANERLEEANADLEATNAKLERRAAELSRSNAELEQFASIASHDLQEPLRKVRTFTEQLSVLEAEHLSDKGRDYLQRTGNAAERMQNLIEDLLKFSRVATHGRPFAPVDLAQVAAEVVDDLEATIADTGAQIHIGELPQINGDALQIRQLLQNLLSNALKFHRDGVPPEVWIDATVAGNRAEITVRDNGIGFENRYSGRIFNVFERLHGRGEYPGTGIGLALVRKIADRHNGSVVAESTPGAGAVFTVTLPLDQAEEILLDRPYRPAADAGADAEKEPHVVLA